MEEATLTVLRKFTCELLYGGPLVVNRRISLGLAINKSINKKLYNKSHFVESVSADHDLKRSFGELSW